MALFLDSSAVGFARKMMHVAILYRIGLSKGVTVDSAPETAVAVGGRGYWHPFRKIPEILGELENTKEATVPPVPPDRLFLWCFI
jgi:hypothetical protein